MPIGFLYALALASTVSAGSSVSTPPSGASTKVLVRKWALRRFEGLPVVSSSPESATLVFGYGRYVGGTAGCNSFFGDKIRWKNGKASNQGLFRVFPKRPLYWTMVLCRDSAQKLGGRFWQAMSHATKWSISGRILTVTFADGSSALLEAVG